MPRKRKAADGLSLVHLQEERSLDTFDHSLDSLAASMKSPEEGDVSVRRRVVELVRGDPAMEKFVKVADSTPKRGSFPSLDMVAAKSGISIGDIVGAIAKAAHQYGFDVGRIIASANVPRVMNTLANQAAHPDGANDRITFFRISEHLKAGGGVQVNVRNTAVAQSNVQGEPQGSRLPSFESDIKGHVTALRRTVIDVQPQNS